MGELRVAVDTNLARRENTDDEIVLGVLGAVERNPAVTQRSVASELGIALGLANAYLKRCIRKGLIKVSQAPARRYAYYLTPQGFAEKSRLTANYLANSLSFFRRARAECGALLATAAARGERRIALIGESDLAEIARLISREHAVDVAGIVPTSDDPAVLSRTVAALENVDAVMITSLDKASEVYAAACTVWGSKRVYAPEILRIRVAAESAGREAHP